MVTGITIPRELPAAAQAYAAAGIKVFRVRRGKAPYANCPRCDQQSSIYIDHRPEDCRCGVPTCHGFWAATTDPDLVRRWWTDEPDANIGAPCALNGWAVLDIDPRHNGDLTLRGLEQCVGVLPGSVMQITGGDGLHILYASPRTTLPGQCGPGIDIKHNGYILLAPSLHSSGHRYHWSGDGRFHPPTTPWPAALAPRPRPVPAPVTELRGAGATRFMPALVKVVLEAQEGERNARLYWAACRAHEHVRAGQIDEGTAMNCLLDAAEQIGLRLVEARQTLASARNARAAA
ncbi:bifunctional DNA primase/polymerase [Streptomyces sp. NBC_01775]|uniref:bifunctional DNA primase/polymerase n=1 Tax=Streptomyces sp. NBC_01775 TaxID=2975939 RepID=UPI002DDC58CE|nr:bifunctional DNA primase/polymerase [Streptomyces sp. NBC_01775]WSB78305.1 bifunctional DNA primase/polymerase [Streptomyces sp. NBC_01775]